MYAAGKIPGGFIKREARPSEAAILAARLTDRPIRPLFPQGYKDDVQFVLTVLSTDQENNPDILGTIAASAALTISEIPFMGPVGAVRVGRIGGEFVVNPTHSQMAESELDLIVAGTRDAIMMVEAGAKILPESVMADAIMFGHRALQPVIELQERAPGRGRQGQAHPVRRAAGRLGRRVRRRPSTPASRSSSSTPRPPARTPEQASSSRSAPSASAAARSIDRFETLVKPTRGIVGNQIHGITNADVEGAPSPAEAAAKLLDFVGDDAVVGHNVGFDIGFIEAALGRRHPHRAGHATSTRSSSLASRLPGPRGPQARPTSSSSSSSRSTPSTARCRTPRPPQPAVCASRTTCPVASRPSSEAVAASVRMRKDGGDSDVADAAFEAALVASGISKSLTTLLHKKTVRELVLDEGIRIDGRDVDDHPPDLGRGRSAAARPRLRPVHPR